MLFKGDILRLTVLLLLLLLVVVVVVLVLLIWKLLFSWTAKVLLPCGSGTTIGQHGQIRISHKISHHSQTKHSTQSYTNNRGHIAFNEYNTTK
jgi:hypothetical protein